MSFTTESIPCASLKPFLTANRNLNHYNNVIETPIAARPQFINGKQISLVYMSLNESDC